MLALAVALPAGGARADGAFPDSQTVLAPTDRPHEILLATNFGLVRSEDDGQTWTWSCEQDGNSFGIYYQVGATPGDRLYTISTRRVAFSDDNACTWQIAGGLLASMDAVDVFPDPTSPARVMAVAIPRGDAPGSYTLLESSDGGATFGTVLFTAASADRITGVEIARADPKTVYLTISSPAGDGGTSSLLRKLARSRDGGATWTVVDLTPTLGAGTVALLAVDRDDPLRVFLRLGSDGASGERLAIVDGGGASARAALELDKGIMQAFARTSSGTILVAGVVVGLASALYRSRDGGATFQSLPAPPRFRGLAERDEIVFGAADDANDPFAVGYSTDEGNTWQPLMHFAQVQAIDTCLETKCQAACQMQAGIGLWPPAVCAATPSPLPFRDLHATTDAAADPGDAAADAATKTSSGGGCHCGSPGAPTWASATVSGSLLLAALGVRRRRSNTGGQRAPKER